MTHQTLVTAAPAGQPPVNAWTINDPAAPWSGSWDVFDLAQLNAPHELVNAIYDELGIDDDAAYETTVLVLADVQIETWKEYGGGSYVHVDPVYVVTGPALMAEKGCEYPGLFSPGKISKELMAKVSEWVKFEVMR